MVQPDSGYVVNLNMSVGDALAAITERHVDQEAITYKGTHISYRVLNDKVDAVAHELRKLGISKGEKVAVILPNSPEFVYAFYGITRASAVVVPINVLYRRQEIEHILSDSEAVAVIMASEARGNDLAATMGQIRPHLPHLRRIIVKGKTDLADVVSLNDMLDAPGPYPLARPSVAPEDVFGLIYTSGTTGAPKGTIHTHRSMLAPVVAGNKLREAMFGKPSLGTLTRVAKILTRYRSRFLRWGGKQQTLMTAAPFHGLTGYGLIMNSLLFGYRLVIIEYFDPVKVLRLIEQEHVNVFVGTPTMYAMLLKVKDFDKYDLSSLLYCVMGAAPCPPQLVREVRKRVGCAVTISFGATELSGGVLVTTIDDPVALQEETVGRPFFGAELKIVDDEHRELPPGQVGELICRGEGVMQGYYKAPDMTAKALDEEGWYYTGDLATIDERGYVRIVGRKKDMIIRGGQNIYPTEIEYYLTNHPQVKQVAVVGVPARIGGESVWAYIVPNDSTQPTAADILDYCRGEIAAYKVPDVVRFVSELPMTANGKVQKSRLREQALAELNSVPSGD